MYEVHNRITLSGQLGQESAPVDGFSMSFATSSQLQQTPSFWETNVRDHCVAWFGDALTHISQRAFLEEVKVSFKGADGKDTGPSVRMPVASQRGGGGEAKFPYQISLAVSLNAATSTRKAKGRFYLPTPDVPWGQLNNQVSASALDEIAARTALLFQQIETGTGDRVVVASRKDGNHPVTLVRIGSVLDTIRSRRNQLPETYSVGTVVT